MKNRLRGFAVATATSVALLTAAVPGGASAKAPVRATAAKACSSGYVSARIGGEQKCLRRGEYCARGYASQYHRYGYNCVALSGASHLEPRALRGHVRVRP